MSVDKNEIEPKNVNDTFIENTRKENVVLSVNDLNITYKTKEGYKKVVDRLSFEMNEGDILGFIGESGSGKSSVSKALVRLLTNYSGVVQLGDDIISGKKIDKSIEKRLHKNLQFIFQDAKKSFNPTWDIYKILSEPLKTNGIVKKMVNDLKQDYEFIIKNSETKFSVAKLQSNIAYYKEMNEFLDKAFGRFYFEEWKDQILSFSNPDDGFNNAMYVYENMMLATYQFANNKLEDQKDSLLKFYQVVQEQYRKNEIEPKEAELFTKMKNYIVAKREAQYSMRFIEVREKIRVLKDELITFIDVHKTEISSNTYMLKSLFDELVQEKNKYWIWMLESKRNEDYNIHWVAYTTFKETIKFFRKVKIESLAYLSNDEIVTIKDILNELIAIVDHEVETSHFPKNEKTIHMSKDYHFQFKDLIKKKIFDSLMVFVDHAQRIKNSNEQYIIELKNKLTGLEEELSRAQIEDTRPHISSTALNDIFNEYEKCRREHHIWYVISSSKFEETVRENAKEEEILKKKYNEMFGPKLLELQSAFEFVVKELFNDYQSDIEAYKLYSKVALTNLPEFETKESFFSNKRIFNIIIDQIEIGNYDAKTRKTTYKQMISHLNIQKKKYKAALNKKEAYVNDHNIQLTTVAVAMSLLSYSENVDKTLKSVEPLFEKKLVYEALSDVGLAREHAFRYTWELSDIQLQRISIARAIISRPKVVIADEPIATLDISLQVQMVNLIKSLSQKYNIAVLFVTEDLAMIEKIAKNIMIIYKGKIVEYGGAKEIYSNKIHPYTRALFRSIPTISSAAVVGFSDIEEFTQTMEYAYADRPQYYKFNSNHFVFGQSSEINVWAHALKMQLNDLHLIGDYIFDQKAIEGYVLFDENKYFKNEENANQLKELIDQSLPISFATNYYVQGNLISNDISKLFYEIKNNKSSERKVEYKTILNAMKNHRKTLIKSWTKMIYKYKTSLKYDGSIYAFAEEPEDNYVVTELSKLKFKNLQNIKNNEGR